DRGPSAPGRRTLKGPRTLHPAPWETMGVMSDYRITVVCTGNICRSPMAEFVLRERFEAAGLGDRVSVDSAGTTAWEEGNPPDPRTLDVLARHGHTGDYSDHRARVFDKRWFG